MMRRIHNEYLDHRFDLPDKVERVVCLVSSATEAMGAMSLLEKIVGVSEYCDRYVDTSTMQVVGQYVTADLDAIQALKPDLVLTTTGIQRKLGQRMVKAGIPIYNLNLPSSFEGMLENIMVLGGLLNEMQKARELVLKMRSRAEQMRAVNAGQTRPKIYVELWLGKHMRAVGGYSYIRDLVDLAGAELVYETLAEGYFVPDLEEVKRHDPDAFVFFHEPEYLVDGDALVAERGWNKETPVIMSTVEMGMNMIQDGPSLLDSADWLRKQLEEVKR